jgi:hypothetical protein
MTTRRTPLRAIAWPLVLAFFGLVLLVAAAFPAL